MQDILLVRSPYLKLVLAYRPLALIRLIMLCTEIHIHPLKVWALVRNEANEAARSLCAEDGTNHYDVCLALRPYSDMS